MVQQRSIAGGWLGKRGPGRAAGFAFAASLLSSACGQQQQPAPTAQPNMPTSNPRLAGAPRSQPGRTEATAPSYTPQNVEVRGDGHCMNVRPGDTVHYTLTIEGMDGVPAVEGDLRLRLGRAPSRSHGDLLLPDFRSLGGGGVGTRDGAQPQVFHFEFRVPDQIYGGTYRGIDVQVHPGDTGPSTQAAGGRTGDATRNRQALPLTSQAEPVDVTRRTRNAVKAYCLNVISSFGVDLRPAVTSFRPGFVEPPSAPASGTLPK